MSNIWILTEERPKIAVLKFILNKLKIELKFEISLESLSIQPIFNEHIFQNEFRVNGYFSKKIKRITISIFSSGSSFVDYLIFVQDK